MKSNVEWLVKNWYKEIEYLKISPAEHRLFIISGYAGCGKTYTAKQIPAMLGIDMSRVAFLTPTGKAARVLHERAQTIHSFIYDYSLDQLGNIVKSLRTPEMFSQRILIVDEISMVSEELLKDLKSINIPIVGLGDPAQLPPVNGTSSILDKPDIFLTHVYRNDGGILALSKDIRESRPIQPSYLNVQFLNAFDEHMSKYDSDTIVICKYNKTRALLNYKIRTEILQFNEMIELGEKLMVLKNNKNTGLSNGSIVEVLKIQKLLPKKGLAILQVVIPHTGEIKEILIDTDILSKKTTAVPRFDKADGVHVVDYAYAITCHKSQGSEFKNVMVVEEGSHFEDHRRWMYTAVTRAQKQLYIFSKVKQW